MKIRHPSTSPLITLRWNEYKRRSAIERFPLSILCGMLILTFSLSTLYDRAMQNTVTDKPVSSGLLIIEKEISSDS